AVAGHRLQHLNRAGYAEGDVLLDVGVDPVVQEPGDGRGVALVAYDLTRRANDAWVIRLDERRGSELLGDRPAAPIRELVPGAAGQDLARDEQGVAPQLLSPPREVEAIQLHAEEPHGQSVDGPR